MTDLKFLVTELSMKKQKKASDVVFGGYAGTSFGYCCTLSQ